MIQTTVVGSYPVPDWLAGLPAEQASNFQALRLDGAAEYPTATVTYHPAFDVG